MRTAVLSLLTSLFFFSDSSFGQSTINQYEIDVQSIDAIMKAYYEVVSGEVGQKRDWERDTYLHHPSAKIWVTGRSSQNISYVNPMTLEEFHDASSGLVDSGFFEWEIHREEQAFGNIIHVWSTYAWSTTADREIGGRGINSIELYFDGNRYWILSWSYDSERASNPIPKEYQNLEMDIFEGEYFGLEKPADRAVLFAPEIISTGMHEHSSPMFTPDGQEVYWSVFFEFRGPQKILYMIQENGKWSEPKVAPFSSHFKDGNPFISADGNRIYFESMRPFAEDDSLKTDLDLWYVDRTSKGWGTAIHMKDINSDKHDRGVSVSTDGTLYFSSERDGGYGKADIYFSELENGQYKNVTNLGSTVNAAGYESWPFIAPDETYILYEKSQNSGTAEKGINISFKKSNGTWTSPSGLGKEINKDGQNRFPMLSQDGKFLFFVSSRELTRKPPKVQLGYQELIKDSDKPGNGWGDVYWISSSIIKQIKNKME